ncbi:hypothetical protein CDAR_88711 [Caerostris darwini]|uniref:Uncharacterized protein n=1 Tax=Caerostris darwini TaxID=1538125 RepID=A0AAV4SLN5_9ARAC|nr:hypothetical protein CDAR_88711 [Caerostris darwini]
MRIVTRCRSRWVTNKTSDYEILSLCEQSFVLFTYIHHAASQMHLMAGPIADYGGRVIYFAMINASRTFIPSEIDDLGQCGETTLNSYSLKWRIKVMRDKLSSALLSSLRLRWINVV